MQTKNLQFRQKPKGNSSELEGRAKQTEQEHRSATEERYSMRSQIRSRSPFFLALARKIKPQAQGLLAVASLP